MSESKNVGPQNEPLEQELFREKRVRFDDLCRSGSLRLHTIAVG